MDIIFTKHAKTRMFQREIDETEIKLTVENADIIQTSFGERIAVRKKFSNKALEVIYKKSGKQIIIITCYWIKEG
ncbi:MAG: DUF4258 domain-containing protein [Elusimicrobiota bacterium]